MSYEQTLLKLESRWSFDAANEIPVAGEHPTIKFDFLLNRFATLLKPVRCTFTPQLLCFSLTKVLFICGNDGSPQSCPGDILSRRALCFQGRILWHSSFRYLISHSQEPFERSKSSYLTLCRTVWYLAIPSQNCAYILAKVVCLFHPNEKHQCWSPELKTIVNSNQSESPELQGA